MTEPIPPTIAWIGEDDGPGAVRLIDQRALPDDLRFVDCRTPEEVADAIGSMAIRGAPALGAAGAFAVALAHDVEGAREAAALVTVTRPTAVNLAWGARRVLSVFEAAGRPAAVAEARAIADADVEDNRAIGRHGRDLVPDQARVYTHCNAGHLACVGYGTALGVIRAAAEAGRVRWVWVGETRPVLQGVRLTAWELARLSVEARVVADGAAGSLMARGEVDVVVVGADRIAANGDVANKIGTYPLAVLAARHGVPFFVAAPSSTIDLRTATGADIPIEDRSPDEVVEVRGVRVAPMGVGAANPAFDVTPAELVTGIVTERGVLRPPFDLAGIPEPPT